MEEEKLNNEKQSKKTKADKAVNKIIVSFIIFMITVCIIVFSIVGDKSGSKVYGVGETAINSDGVSFCITNVKNTKSLGYKTTTKNFIIIDITVTNNSKETIEISGSCVDLYNSKEAKYEYYEHYDINWLGSEIAVGFSKSFKVVFETPATTDDEEYIAKIGYSSFTSDRDRVSIRLDKSNNSVLENYNIGDTFNFDDLDITVEKYELVTGYLFGDYMPKENYTLVVVYVDIYNTSNNTKTLKSGLNLVYSEDLVADNSINYGGKFWTGGYGGDKFINNYDSIIAQGTLSGVYVYEIPDIIAETSKLEFRFTFNKVSKQDRIINVLLRETQESQ